MRHETSLWHDLVRFLKEIHNLHLSTLRVPNEKRKMSRGTGVKPTERNMNREEMCCRI